MRIGRLHYAALVALLVLTVRPSEGQTVGRSDGQTVGPFVLPSFRLSVWQGGERLDLSDLSDPVALERRLRNLLGGGDPSRVTLISGRVHRGAFGLGSLDTLRGHLLVLGGSAAVYGRLTGNLVTLDGDIVIHPGGVVDGDVLALGGSVRDQSAGVTGEARSLDVPRRAQAKVGPRIGIRIAGFAGVALTLLALGLGMVTFARPSLEIVSDTVVHSLGRSFIVGLLAEVLVIPTFGMLVVGLALTVVGILLIPFAVIAYGLLVLAALVLGVLAVAHAMGETHTRRRMASGLRLSPNGYRYVLIGLAGLLAVWVVWLLFGWVPTAGSIVFAAALLVTWVLATVGFGASLLSRLGVRGEFAGRIVPPEALTDEYLWATPQAGVPAAQRPERKQPPEARE